MKKILSTLLAAVLLSSLIVAPAFACEKSLNTQAEKKASDDNVKPEDTQEDKK